MEYFMIIRFFGLLIIALYVYIKILNIKVSKLKIISAILFSLIMSVPLSYVSPFYELIFLGSFCIFAGITTRVKPMLLVTAVFISTGISLGIEILAFTIIVLQSFLLQTILQIPPINIMQTSSTIVETMVFIISVIVSYFFFRVKRLKKGFVFLESKEAKWIGIIFSIIIMFSRSVLNEPVAILFAINTCTIGIYFWWQNHTTMLYHQRLKEREIETYLVEIEEKDKQIKELYESNYFLSKAIHRDNKLIPAMYNAVNGFLTNQINIDDDMRTTGINIMSELDEIMKERKEMILEFQRQHKSLPATQIDRIDYMLNHMFLKATENEIQFDLIISGKIKDIIETVISKQKLETLLADLIENAIIAVSYSTNKKILITMAVIDNCFEINIQDSGIPFEVETLADLGKRKATTHADRGGSGIGYLTIFKILGESGASLIISELSPGNHSFSKSIKVRFDKKSEYVIHSNRL